MSVEREKQIAEEMAAVYHHRMLSENPHAQPPGDGLKAVFAVVAQKQAELEAECKRVFEENFMHREPLADPPHFLDVTLPEEAYETFGVAQFAELREDIRRHRLGETIDKDVTSGVACDKLLEEIWALRKAKRALESKLYNITWHITRAWQEHQR